MTRDPGFNDASLPLFQASPVAAASKARVPSYLRDHRKRLRERFMSGGAQAMPDYELLELLLFRAIPRQDVKPLARTLINAFGDLAGVISAPEAQLLAIPNVGMSVVTELRVVAACAHRMTRARVQNRPLISSWDALLDYCHTTMSHRDTEEFRVLFLDRKNRLIADEAQGRGTVDHVPVYPREIMRRALELSATALILVHNHPSGDPTPSDADIAMTDQVRRAGEHLSVTLHDHLIIGKSCELSFRAAGLL
jgi:DNA repair protein RadC